MKKIIALLLIVCIASVCLLAGCGNNSAENSTNNNANVNSGEYVDPTLEREVQVIDDKFRNYYHIWVCAFEDSNGDETGDLQGIIDKLDYINDGNSETDTDLGMTGIWLSPIMPSTSYHKYDVDDYMDIDPEFGDLETFDKLIEECDKRGIDVILDLVLNHCGTDHVFFENAMKEAKEGNLDGYAKYYRFVDGERPGDGWRNVIGYPNLWYEGQFSPEMPEWNLASEDTRDYFEEVAKFWLERGVAGFRLDAVKYMTDETTDGAEFLGWFYEAAKKYNPDVYMVGENWQGNSYLYDIYESGIDSQFAFSFGTSTGNFATAVNSGTANTYLLQLEKFDRKSAEANPDVIHAMFLSNHDMVRSGSYFSNELPRMKMAAAVYMLVPGNSFTYYGEEIGMLTPPANKENDAFFRSPMIWDSDVEPDIWCTGDAYSIHDMGGVKQQENDPDSLLNFYKRVNKIKAQNPEIARGRVTDIYPDENNNSIAAYKIATEDSSVLIVINLDGEFGTEFSITDDMMSNPVISADLYAGGDEIVILPNSDITQEDIDNIPEYASLEGGKLVLPPRTAVVIREAE